MKMIASLGLSLLFLTGTLSATRGETFRTDINPALLYYQAFLQEPHLTAEEDNYWVSNNWRAPLPEPMVNLLGYYHTDLKLWHQAAKQTAPCDWGIDLSRGPETLLPELAQCKKAAQVLLLHTTWELQQGQEADACEDLLAALAAGRNSSRDGTLIAVLVQIAIENMVVAGVAEHFQYFSPQSLQALAQGFDTTPARRTLSDCLASEKFIFGRWLNARIQELQQAHPDDHAAVMRDMQRLFDNIKGEDDTNYWREVTNAAGGTVAGMVKMTEDSETLADRLVPILRLPHGEFEVHFQRFYDGVRQSGNFLFGDSLHVWASSRRKEFIVQAELAMVRAAIEYKLHGNAGLQEVADPFGNGSFTFGRFVYQGVDRGFQLQSAYVPASTPALKPWSANRDSFNTNAPSTTPVTMIFVEKDGPPFNVLGNRVGQPVSP